MIENFPAAAPGRMRFARGGGFALAFMLSVVGLLLPATAAISDPTQNAQEVIKAASSQAIAVLKERHKELQENPQRIFQFVEEYLLPHFDMDYVSRQVLGKNWRDATPEERERFRRAFQESLIRSYGSSMLQYSDQQINFLPFKEDPDAKQTVVKTEVDTTSGKPAAVDYTMRRTDDAWKVVDVTIEGISMVVNYRSQFNEEIRRLRGLAPLIAKLEERNRMGITSEPNKPAK